MNTLARRRVMVAGAGVVGSSVALMLARAGASVWLVDPAPLGENASGVAAGMLAPVFEAVLDPDAARHYSLLRAARDRWPTLAEVLGVDRIGFRRSGGLWASLPEDPADLLEARLRALEALGVVAEPLSPEAIRELAPDVRSDVGPGLLTGEDWRVDPLAGLARLRETAVAAGVTVIATRLLAFESGAARLADGQRLAADQLVIATGAETADLAPELAMLSPIKGHILRFPGLAGGQGLPALRWSGGYALGGSKGLIIGATMEPGLSDRRIDAAAVERLRTAAVTLFPRLESERAVAQAGIRAATPDALPLVGASSRAGVFLAVGVRRNGWLLGPLIAEMVVACLTERDAGPFTALLDARRFAGASTWLIAD